MLKVIPISWGQVKVGIAALLSEAGYSFTCIGEENKLIYGLLRSKATDDICKR